MRVAVGKIVTGDTGCACTVRNCVSVVEKLRARFTWYGLLAGPTKTNRLSRELVDVVQDDTYVTLNGLLVCTVGVKKKVLISANERAVM